VPPRTHRRPDLVFHLREFFCLFKYREADLIGDHDDAVDLAEDDVAADERSFAPIEYLRARHGVDCGPIAREHRKVLFEDERDVADAPVEDGAVDADRFE
jgi:hypothetical protein